MSYYSDNEYWMRPAVSGASSLFGKAIGNNTEGAGAVIGGVMDTAGDLAGMIPGPLGMGLQAGLKVVGGLANKAFGYKLNKENVNAIENNIGQLKGFTSNAGDWSSFMANLESAPTAMNFTLKDVGSNGWFNHGATDKYNSLMSQITKGLNWSNRAIENNAAGISKSQLGAAELNYYTPSYKKGTSAAYGGPLFMRSDGILSPFGNRFNYGGMSALATHGADWNNGLKFINVGGSHEENPYEGVQMGVDQEGTPNLVEEGEVIWNDYVFSNRMVVPKRVKEKLGIKGMNDITYAEAAKKIQKEAEERPNDPISKRGLDATLGRLAYAQEEDRQKKQEEEQQQAIMAAYGGELATDNNEENISNESNENNEYAKGGKLGNLFPGDGPYPNILYGNKYPYNINEGIYFPQSYFFNTNEEGAFPYEWAYNEGEPLKTPQKILTEHKNKYIENKGLPFFPTPINRIKLQFKNPIQHDVYGDNGWTPTPQSKSTLEAKPKFAYADNLIVTNPKEPQKKKSFDLSYLRYAPAIGSAINVFTDLAGLTNKPDYSSADSLTAATQNLRDVRPPSIGDYVRYTPFDRMFYLNQLNANAGATRRGLMDIAGGNRGAAMAGLLASDYNTLGKIGELARQAEEYNLANRLKTAEFNRGTNQFNSEMDLKAQMANNQNASIKLDVLAKAAAIRDAIDARVGAARSANLTNFFDNLGNIGWEAANRNMTRGITRYELDRFFNPVYAGLGYGYNITPEEYNEIIERRKKADKDWKAAKSKKGTPSAYGGLLTYKRRK